MSEANTDSTICSAYPPVLDVCCGPRGMWFNKNNPLALYCDRRHETIEMTYPSGQYREEIHPDVLADFTNLPFPGNTFQMVVFDPPHLERSGADGRMTKRYGYLSGNWRKMLSDGFRECFRVLKPEGTLIFKWCEIQFPIKDIISLSPEPPLFGHRSGKRMNTHWVAFMKPPAKTMNYHFVSEQLIKCSDPKPWMIDEYKDLERIILQNQKGQ